MCYGSTKSSWFEVANSNSSNSYISSVSQHKTSYVAITYRFLTFFSQLEDFLLCFLSHMILYIVVKQYLINTFLSLAVSPIYRVFQTLDTGPVSAEKWSQLFAWKSHITTTGGHRATSSKNSLFLSLNFLISGNYFSIEFEWRENALISVEEETLFCIPVKQRTEFCIS